jgi:AraC-like DNA-binding protein
MASGENELKSVYRYFPVSDRDKKWGVYVTTVGWQRIRADQAYPPSGHPKGYDCAWEQGRILQEHALVYISRGGGWFESDHAGRNRVESGQAFYLFPKVWHRYAPDLKTGWDEHWMGFDGDVPRRFQEFFSRDEPVFNPAREERFLELFMGLLEFMQLNVVALQQVMGGAVCQILGLLYSGRQARLSGSVEVSQAIRNALEYINSNFVSGVDAPALARNLGVSYSWLRHRFVEHTGLAPLQYVQELRLARARSLLNETTLPVKEIATQAGFEQGQFMVAPAGLELAVRAPG